MTKQNFGVLILGLALMLSSTLGISTMSFAQEDTWTTKAPMPVARNWLSATTVDGKIYVIGGFAFPSSGIRSLTKVEVYDPATDTWERKADMPTPRWGIGAVAARSKIYVFGGAVDNTHRNTAKTVEMYDIVADTWTPKANMPLPYLSMGVSFVNNGKAYVIGGKEWGEDDWNFFQIVSEYDIEKDKWKKLEDLLPTPRESLATSVVNGKIYAIGGNAGWPTRAVEEYTPDRWPFPDVFDVSPQGKLAATWGEIKRR